MTSQCSSNLTMVTVIAGAITKSEDDGSNSQTKLPVLNFFNPDEILRRPFFSVKVIEERRRSNNTEDIATTFGSKTIHAVIFKIINY